MKNPNEYFNHQIKLGNGQEYIILDGGNIDNKYYYLATTVTEPKEIKVLVRKEGINGSVHVYEYKGTDYERKLLILSMVYKITSEHQPPGNGEDVENV